jgi:hypothetical protein
LFLAGATLKRTEHYQITKAFLEHPGRMLRELFREDTAADPV